MRYLRKISIFTVGAVYLVCGNLLAAELSCEEQQRGFVSLFDGKTLNGWVGATKGYAAEDGKIVCPKDGGGNLFTENEYSDFVLRFEFKLEANGNNGLGIRAPLGKNAAYAGMELQILDNSGTKYKDKLKPWQYHGSIYGVVPAKRGFMKPVGEWNYQEVIADGRRIKVILNGETIVDADIDEVSTPKTIDGRDHPGLKRTKGHIGFLGHGARLEFRNLRVRDLTMYPIVEECVPQVATQCPDDPSILDGLFRVLGGLFD